MYVTEGYMDVLTLHQFGFTNSVGGLGTALTDQQVKRILGYTPTVMLLYDGDNADKAQKVADLLGCGTVMKNDGRYTYTGDILVIVGQDWK